MPDRGIVRSWDDEQGWGVVDAEATPGGCWVHFSVVAGPGPGTLTPGAAVELEHEPAQQDGYAHRAVRVWPVGAAPAPPPPAAQPSEAYRSTVRLQFDAAPPAD